MLDLFLILFLIELAIVFYKMQEKCFSKILKRDKECILNFYNWYEKICLYTTESNKINFLIASIFEEEEKQNKIKDELFLNEKREHIKEMVCEVEVKIGYRIKFYKSIQWYLVFMKKNYQEEAKQILQDFEEILHEIHLYKWKNSIE